MDPSIPDEEDDADAADDVLAGDEEPVEVFLVGVCIAPTPGEST